MKAKRRFPMCGRSLQYHMLSYTKIINKKIIKVETFATNGCLSVNSYLEFSVPAHSLHNKRRVGASVS